MGEPMTIPADRRLLGGSDIGALLGISPYSSAADVWLRVVYGEQLEMNDVMDHGLLMEPGLFALIQSEAPGKYQTHPTLRHPHFEHGVGHLDLLRKEPSKAVVDAKMVHWTQREKWDNGVPDFVRTQLDWYMQCAGTDEAWVGAFFGLGDFRLIRVEPLDADTRSSILEVVERFWRDHVETGEPPPPDGSEACASILTRLHPVKGVSVPLDAVAVEHARKISELKRQLKELEAQEEFEKQQLERWLSERNAKAGRSESMSVAWSKTTRDGVDWKALATHLNPSPELLSRFAKHTEFTSLRVTEKKS